MQREFMGPRLIRSYQTLGDLRLRFGDKGQITDYRRQLDLDAATVTVTYRLGDATFTREVFSSPVDQCIVVRLSCDKPAQITFDASLWRPEDFTVETIRPDCIVIKGQATMKSEHKGVNFEARLKIIPEGGKLTATDEGLRLENADAATLLIAAATNYRGDDPQAVCEKQLAAAGRKNYPELRRAHLAEHRRLFRRVALNLVDKDALGKPTDERLAAMKSGTDDPALCALYFQFGRYLLISSSRPGCIITSISTYR